MECYCQASHMRFPNKKVKCGVWDLSFCSRLIKCGGSSLLWSIAPVRCSVIHTALAENACSSERNCTNKPFSGCCHNLLKALTGARGHLFLASPLLLCQLCQRKLNSLLKANLPLTVIPVSLTSQSFCFAFQRPRAFLPDAICTWTSCTWTQRGEETIWRSWTYRAAFSSFHQSTHLCP